MLKDDYWACGIPGCEFKYYYLDQLFNTSNNFFSVILRGGACPFDNTEISFEDRCGMLDHVLRILNHRIYQLERAERAPHIDMQAPSLRILSDQLEEIDAFVKALERNSDRRIITWSTHVKELRDHIIV